MIKVTTAMLLTAAMEEKYGLWASNQGKFYKRERSLNPFDRRDYLSTFDGDPRLKKAS